MSWEEGGCLCQLFQSSNVIYLYPECIIGLVKVAIGLEKFFIHASRASASFAEIILRTFELEKPKFTKGLLVGNYDHSKPIQVLLL